MCVFIVALRYTACKVEQLDNVRMHICTRCISACVCVCVGDSPVMGVAVFLGVVTPGSEHLGVEGFNLHEKLRNTGKKS